MADIRINDLPALVTQASNDVYEMSNNAVSLSSKETRAQMQTWMQTKLTGISQVIWVNALSGSNTTGNGSANSPYATYAYAVAQALTRSPTIIKQILINLVGNFSETLTLYPFIHIDQLGSGTFTSAANITNDSSFDTTPDAFCVINNMGLESAVPITIIYGAAQNQKIAITNCTFGDIPNIAHQGFSGAELLYIQNAFPNGSSLSAGISSTKGIVALDNATVLGSCNVSCDSSVDSTLSIKNSVIGGIIYIDSTSSMGGVPSLQLYNSINAGYQLSGTGSLASIDPFSYTSVPLYFGGSSITQVTITSLTDSLLQTSFSPSNYSGVGSSDYSADSLTGQLAGIDAALSTGGAGDLQDVYDNTAATPTALIVLDVAGTKPIRLQNSATGSPQSFLQFTNSVNPNSSTIQPWGQDYLGLNTAPTVVSYGRTEIYVSDPSAGFEKAGWRVNVLDSGIVTTILDVSGDDGSISVPVIGGTLKIAQGSNACAGTGAVMVGGQVTVTTSAAATGDIILLTCTTSAGTPGIPSYTISNGVSFTIFSTSALDTSTYAWVIIKAA